jgi:hypothetical protein
LVVAWGDPPRATIDHSIWNLKQGRQIIDSPYVIVCLEDVYAANLRFDRKCFILVICMCIVPQLTWADASPSEQSKRDDNEFLNYRKPLEIRVAPDVISWIKVDQSSLIEFIAHRADFERLDRESIPYRESLPFESRHSKEEMDKLRKDLGQWLETYQIELRELLKDQYYIWEEVHELKEVVEEIGRTSMGFEHAYVIDIGLIGSPQGITNVRYVVPCYFDARTIAEDLRMGESNH